MMASVLMKRRLTIVLLAAGLLLAALVGFNLFKGYMMREAMASNAAPAQTVTAQPVIYTQWQPELGAVGSLRAVRGVDVTTEIAGLVRTVRFKSGDDAKSGQLLVELNADSDIAQMHSLEAAAQLAGTVLNRDKLQYDAQAISKAQLDADEADLKNKRAQVAAQAAIVAKKQLTAPFAGRLGITTVNPGQYLNAGDKVVTLQALDPVYVDFRMPQLQLAQVAVGQTVSLTCDAYPGATFTGKVNAIDPRVDPATRNFQVEASVPNPHHRLMPGMFARVSVAVGAQQRYLTLPQTAISYNPYGTTVFLALRPEQAQAAHQAPSAASKRTGDRKPGSPPALQARQVFVTLGATRGDQVAVLEGLSEGDLVVTSGQLKLTNGVPLVINNQLLPTNEPNPTPQEH